MKHVTARGPSMRRIYATAPRILRDPLGTFLDWHREYGDIIRVPVRNPPSLHLCRPDDIHHVLTVNPGNYRKTGALIIGRRLMGRGLIASHGQLHAHQRRIMMPHFHKQSVASFAPIIAETASEQISRWKPEAVVNAFPEMARMTLTVLGRAYFSNDFAALNDEIVRSFGICQKFMQRLAINIPDSFPTPLNIRYRRAVTRIDRIIYNLIDERRKLTQRPGDLLTTLIEAADENGNPLGDQQIRDELVNIILAGHETTANALTWTLNFLSDHPDVEAKLFQEIDNVLGGKLPNADDLQMMRYLEMVLSESIRLRPPLWIIGRMTIEDDILPSGFPVPKGTEILMMPYVVHRDPRFFPNPELFDPERFSDESRKSRPAHTFFPFSEGPRGCIGEPLARTEAAIILAVIAQRFSLRRITGCRAIPDPLVTLRPRFDILMHARPRTTFASDRLTTSGTRPAECPAHSAAGTRMSFEHR